MTRAGALWLLALGWLPLAGAIPLAHPAFRRFPLLGRVVLAGAVGAVLVSTAMTLTSVLGWRWSAGSLAITSGALALLLRACVPREPDSPIDPSAYPQHAVWRLTSRIVIAVAVAAAFAATAASAATSADLLLLWGPKAQQFAAVRTIDASYLGDPIHEYMNLSYPPLVTNLFALATMFAGRFSWGGAMLTFPILLLALAAALPSAFELDRMPRRTLPWCALAVSLIGSAGVSLRIAGNGDMALLFFEATALALLLGAARADPAMQVLAGVLLAGAATAKVEGLPFVAAAGALFLFANRRARTPGSALRLWAPSAAALGIWFLFGLQNRVFFGYRGFGPLLQIFWGRLPSVIASIGRALVEVHFGLPFLLPLAVLLAAPPRTRRGWLPAAVGVAIAAFLLFNYLHVPDPTEWIGWSAGRVLLALPVFFTLSSASRELEI